MKVKAQALIHAATWLEETHGRDAVGAVLSRCSKALKERYMSAIAIEWCPLQEFTEFLEATEAQVGRGDGRTARDSGSFSARMNTRGLVARSAFYLASPEFLLRRVAGFWSQYNDEGTLHLREFNEKKIVMELTDMTEKHKLLCASVTGWIEVIADAVGARGCVASHPQCRTTGHRQCVYVVNWDARKGVDEFVAAARRS